MNVSDDADDCVRILVVPRHFDLSAERILPRPRFARHRFVHDDDVRLRSVLRTEETTRAQRNLERAEVVPGDDSDVGDRFVADRRLLLAHDFEARRRPRTTQRQPLVRTDSLHAWQRLDAREEPIVNARTLAGESCFHSGAASSNVMTCAVLKPGDTDSSR